MAQPKNIEVLKLRKMVEYFVEWQLEEAQSILAQLEETTIKNKQYGRIKELTVYI